MNILLLEDRGSVNYYLKKVLEEESNIVFLASNIYEAQDYLETGKPLDCLIVDLNMNPDGLSHNLLEKTQGGVLTGWVWLVECVFPKDITFRHRTIIFSEYLRELKQHVSEKDLTDIFLVAKTDTSSPIDTLLSYVKRIANLKEEKKK